jgi:ribosomal protein L7/L12
MIAAIKIYRAWSGVSLREATTAVEAVARRRR